MAINDNHSAIPGVSAPDAATQAQAALVLVESLIHGLVERSVITTADAVAIIGAAIDVQVDVAEAADGAGQDMWRAHGLLLAMADSLKHDLDDGGEHPTG